VSDVSGGHELSEGAAEMNAAGLRRTEQLVALLSDAPANRLKRGPIHALRAHALWAKIIRPS